MPRLSLDAKLDRQLAESVEGSRFRDCAIVLRRLTLARPVREGAELVDSSGRLWKAGEVAEDGVQPVATVSVGASATVAAGEWLRCGDVVVELCAEVICAGGGVWDLVKNDWRLDAAGRRVAATHPVTVDLMESQVSIGRWAGERVAAFREQRSHPQSVCELYADRAAGKTFVGVLIVLLCAFDAPRIGKMPLTAWLVSTQHGSRDELDREIKAILPGSGKDFSNGGLFVYRELPKHQYRLLNGAVIQHKTIDDPEAQLRSGTVDVALLNEGASMPLSVFRNTIRRTVDHFGFIVITTNTPKKTRGSWVTRLADGAAAQLAAGKVPSTALFRPDKKLNAAIRIEANGPIDEALRSCLGENDTIDEGVILEADDKCYSPPFSLEDHVRPLPQVGLVDVTAELLKRLHGRPYTYLVGADFQQQNAAVAFRIYAPRIDDPASWKNFCMWAVRGWFLKGGGDEHDLIDLMEGEGFRGDNCLVVGDCSGQWQKGDHGYGPVSFDIFKSRGWEIVAPTKKKGAKGLFSKNPDVEQSVGQLRTAIKAGRFMVAPGEAAANVAKALHKCDATVDRLGNLRPKGLMAHTADCCRYSLFFLSTRVGSVASPLPSYVTNRR